ncbi:MAG: CvpA family protein [Alphaproteobacteria bacterium]|nr:CvpA family protein [Alphaproteobacteria bacterium]
MVIDILVGLVLLVSALISFLRGFIREILTIFGTLGALAAAYYAGPALSPMIRLWLGVKEGEPVPELFDMVPYTIVADVLSYGAVFLGVLIVLSIVSHILAETARKIGLGAVDRTLGVIFGIARGFVILSLAFIPVKLFASPTKLDDWFAGSKSRIYLDMGSSWLMGLLPEGSFDTPDQSKTAEPDARQKLEQMKLLGGDTAKKN